MAWLFPVVVILPLVGFWMWMFRDMVNNRYLTTEARNYWMLAFVLMNVFGAVWYYVVEYRNQP